MKNSKYFIKMIRLYLEKIQGINWYLLIEIIFVIMLTTLSNYIFPKHVGMFVQFGKKNTSIENTLILTLPYFIDFDYNRFNVFCIFHISKTMSQVFKLMTYQR